MAWATAWATAWADVWANVWANVWASVWAAAGPSFCPKECCDVYFLIQHPTQAVSGRNGSMKTLLNGRFVKVNVLGDRGSI